MMASPPSSPALRIIVLRAWRAVAYHIGLGHAGEFVEGSKEGLAVQNSVKISEFFVARESDRVGMPGQEARADFVLPHRQAR
jgi:hypothetical protein